MTAHNPITAGQALAMVEAVGVTDARRLIADQAAADLLKSYAMVIQMEEAGRRSPAMRGAVISPELWRRIIREDCVNEVWDGGTVRLQAAELIGGAPAVEITDISFHEGGLQRLIDRRRGMYRNTSPRKNVAATPIFTLHEEEQSEPPSNHPSAGPDLSALHSGALHLTRLQTMAALSISKTSFYKLLNAGDLERAPSKAGTRVTTASVRKYAGLSA